MLLKRKRPALLVLIRHGESLRNLAKGKSIYFPDEESRRPVQGIPDHKIELTPTGHKQAGKTGAGLRARFGVPDYLYHSGYTRTVQTMEGILDAYPAVERQMIQIRENLYLRERDPGFTYDMTDEEVDRYFPWLRAHWKTKGGFFARPPGGESLADMVQRIQVFLDVIFRDREGQKVFVVMHGHVLRCFRYLLEHWTYDEVQAWPEGEEPKNCGITAYARSEESGRLELSEYNTVCW
jgi:broad specificity phosphatase PhoE